LVRNRDFLFVPSMNYQALGSFSANHSAVFHPSHQTTEFRQKRQCRLQWLTPPSKDHNSRFTIYDSGIWGLRTRVYSTLLERSVAPHPFNSRIWGHERPTAGFFRSADWRNGDSRLIGTVAVVPMKTPLIRFIARRCSPPRIEPATFPFPPFLRCAMHGAQKNTSAPSHAPESWNRRPSGAAKFRRNCGAGRPSVQGLGRASRRCRVAHLKFSLHFPGVRCLCQ